MRSAGPSHPCTKPIFKQQRPSMCVFGNTRDCSATLKAHGTGGADVRAIADEYDLMLEMMVNHISPASAQFQDFLAKGDASEFADMFIDWRKFWGSPGVVLYGLACPGRENPPPWHCKYSKKTLPALVSAEGSEQARSALMGVHKGCGGLFLHGRRVMYKEWHPLANQELVC